MITQWVPLYESTADVVKSEIATFFAVFSAGIILENNDAGVGYDLVLLGIPAGTRVDLDQVERRLDQPDYAGAANRWTRSAWTEP